MVTSFPSTLNFAESKSFQIFVNNTFISNFINMKTISFYVFFMFHYDFDDFKLFQIKEI